MANTTDRELIEMYQKRLEIMALENLVSSNFVGSSSYLVQDSQD